MAGDGKQITLTEQEIEKFKELDEAEKFNHVLRSSYDGSAGLPLIQMVPQVLRSCYDEKDFEQYFEPTSVAMGPLNHQRKPAKVSRIERGEECKLKLTSIFIKGSGCTTEYFYRIVKKEIDRLRKCYNSKEPKWTDEELAWMLLVDGCALLVFMFLDGNNDWEEFSVCNDVVRIVKADFFLLENQLPYKLLKILTDSLPEDSLPLTRTSLKELSKKFITNFIERSFLDPISRRQHQNEIDHLESPHPDKQQEEKDPRQHQIEVDHLEPSHPDEQQQEDKDPPHLLYLLRSILIVKLKEKGEKQKWINRERFLVARTEKSKYRPSICNVKELKAKGIRFKAWEKEVAIRDTVFNNCCWVPTLTLAPIFLHNTTMSLLLNLMAYELCPDYKEDCEITSHLSFLGSLIADGKDVKELGDAGVLHHEFGSDEAVAELFNKISFVRVPNLEKDFDLRRDISAYCNSKKSYFAKVVHTYFSGTWNFCVFLGSLATFIMLVMQTYYSSPNAKLP